MKHYQIIPSGVIENKILLFRGHKVIVDADLAVLYGVTTKRLKEQVRRNIDRFPEDFMFKLTAAEKKQVAANCGHLAHLKYSPFLPYAFTEYGALMAANVLNSPKAVRVSIQIVRAFMHIRRVLSSHAELARKLVQLERKYDEQFKVVFEAIRRLVQPPERPGRRIGFRINEQRTVYHTRRK